jgi:KipI family sensor histidine kinase inhibitor
MVPAFCRAGESAVLARFGAKIDLEISKRVLACLSTLDKKSKPDGIGEMLPGYASVLVRFDPLRVSRQEVEDWIRDAADAGSAQKLEPPRNITIPVKYGGDGGPDLEEIAKICGLGSAADVIAAHSGGDYRVYFLGFLGGFPYLGGLQPPLTAVGRLSTPRMKLPAGTVGIAGGQTGIYPVSSPGGWYLLGRTPKTLFDPLQDPPALLKAGDLVKFVPTDEPIPEETEAVEAAAPVLGAKWIEIVDPGPQTSVQDVGRYGYARHGVSRSGAADDLSLRMGNALVGNAPETPGLEVMMGGLKMKCAYPCAIALTGADCGATLKRPEVDEPISLNVNERIFLEKDDLVELKFAKDGMRAYVCVQGGVAVPGVLGSASTDIRGNLGGFLGRTLKKGDVLCRSETVGGLPALQSALFRNCVNRNSLGVENRSQFTLFRRRDC